MTGDKQKDPLYRAQALLARRDHSVHELSVKLKQRGFTPVQINNAVRKLQKLRILNDANFADTYASQILFAKPVGPRWITQKLRQKGISEEIISRAVAKHFPPGREKKLAAKAAESWRRTHQKHAADSQRLSRHLSSRGFSSDAIYSV